MSEVVVISHKEKSFKELAIDESKIIIDLVNFPEFHSKLNYQGLCW